MNFSDLQMIIDDPSLKLSKKNSRKSEEKL